MIINEVKSLQNLMTELTFKTALHVFESYQPTFGDICFLPRNDGLQIIFDCGMFVIIDNIICVETNKCSYEIDCDTFQNWEDYVNLF